MADYKKPDHWQQQARKEGYPARSVYKLKEIDEKFPLFKPVKKKPNSAESIAADDKNPVRNFRVLDIGAAPGSWSLYVLRKFSSSKNIFLAAVDLSPLSREFDQGLFDSGKFFFIQGDAAAEEVREALLSKGPYSVIISDAAPGTTGNHIVDCARSLELAEVVFAYAESALVSGGNLALKVFQGGGVEEQLKRMKGHFNTAKSFKPQACRGESVETYFLGLGKK